MENDLIRRKDAYDSLLNGMVMTGYQSRALDCIAEYSIPAVDAVPVVRCKDCKFLSHFTDGHLECRLLYDLRPVPCTYVTMRENDFCSYGERREVTE